MTGETLFIGVDTARSNFDTVDGETVILDSTTGVLTLLVGNGALIWERLVPGVERGELLREIADTYDEAARADADAFLDQLVEAGLVVPVSAPAGGAAEPTPWPSEYSPAQIERYDDIADIMMMDPIHEVDKTLGWPHASAGGAGGARDAT